MSPVCAPCQRGGWACDGGRTICLLPGKERVLLVPKRDAMQAADDGQASGAWREAGGVRKAP